jgi:site-specific DNA-methyltransferase (cytosine-N4-specific)
MPESVRDRCTKAHEYMFLFSKRERYYWDFEAMQEPASYPEGAHSPDCIKSPYGQGFTRRAGAHPRIAALPVVSGWAFDGEHTAVAHNRPHLPGNKTHKGTTAYEAGAAEHRTKAGLVDYATRVRERVGKDATSPRQDGNRWNENAGRGFLPPRKLADENSGTKNNDSMDEALSEMRETRNKRSVWTIASEPFKAAHFATFPKALIVPCIRAGSRPGDTIFDPFMGSGTTAEVASDLGRNFIGCELNPAYAAMYKAARSQQVGFAL